jgi:outer membrane protein assembly factor BamB
MNLNHLRGSLWILLLAVANSAFSQAEGTLKWSFLASRPISSSPAVGSDGSIYFGAEDGRIYGCRSNGTVKWMPTLTQGAVSSTPAVSGDAVYFGSWDGRLYAVSASSGSRLWFYATGSYIHSSPAVGKDGTIYVGSGDGSLHAVNPNGSGKWIYQTLDWVDSSPAIGPDGSVIFGSWDGNVRALSPDGQLLWIYQTDGPVLSSPAIAEDRTTLVGSSDGYLYALLPDGRLRWKFAAGDAIEASPAIAPDGTVYVGTAAGRLHAVNADGSLRWTYVAGTAGLYSSPVIRSDGVVIVGSDDFRLHAVNADGSARWTFATGDFVEGSPAIGSDGTIYFTSLDRRLYALHGSGSLANGQWPQFSRDLARSGRRRGPVITAEPGKRTVPLGAVTEFAVNASGSGPLNFQWIFNGAPLLGSAGPSLMVTAAASTAGTYAVRITDSEGASSTQPATLRVSYPGGYLATSQGGGFAAALAREDGSASFLGYDPATARAYFAPNFEVTSDGAFAFSTDDGSALTGQLQASGFAGSGGANGWSFAGERLESAVWFDGYVGAPVELANALLFSDDQVAVASRSGQGHRGGIGRLAADRSLTLELSTGGSLQGSATADGAAISGLLNDGKRFHLQRAGTEPAGRLANISTRGIVGSGDEVMIAGFVIEGPGTKRVLVTAKGPTLDQYGLVGTLNDPYLRLFAGGTEIAANDSWPAAAAAAEIAVNPFRPDFDREPALLLDLEPGVYTAVVGGAGNTVGAALVEVYELNSDETARLINISTRGRAASGDAAMIGGFVVTGAGPRKVMVRALGPTLSGFGVAGALPQPRIRAVALMGGQQFDLSANSRWTSGHQVGPIAATPYAPGTGEPAIILWLEPGIYTALLDGADGVAGVGLIEVYDLSIY